MSKLSTLALTLIALVVHAIEPPYLTGETGHRTGSNLNSQTATKNGPVLLQDIYAIEKLRRFNHERIPERAVHGRGVGAHGFFISTRNMSNFTAASFLSGSGQRTEIFVRFSTVIHGKHSPETLRDPRGFAVKFKTVHEGNFDLVGNSLPVFFIRDHIKFPDMVHSLKPDPVTNRQDPNRIFDFFSALGGMATHMLTYLYSDLGIPRSYREMEGNSVHAYKLVNAKKKVTYAKFRWFPMQGVHNLTIGEAAEKQKIDFGHATKDLYDKVESGDFPRWSLQVQTMAPDVLENFMFDPLDATKEWPEKEFPFKEIGKLVINRIPDNFYQFTEQSAFSPGNFLPGSIEPSEDRLLQGRLVSYHESQTHRLGSSNFNHLPVNRPIANVHNYNQNGAMSFFHAWKGRINYEPSNDPDAYRVDTRALYAQIHICGLTQQKPIRKTLNFHQAGQRYLRFDENQRKNLIRNLAADLVQVRSEKVRNTMCAHFYKANKDYGTRVSRAVACNVSEVVSIAQLLQE